MCYSSLHRETESLLQAELTKGQAVNHYQGKTMTTYTNTITQEMERLAANPSLANRSLLRFLAKQSPDMTLGEAMAKYFARF